MSKRILSLIMAVSMLFGSAALLPEDTFSFETSITASADSSGDFEYMTEEDAWGEHIKTNSFNESVIKYHYSLLGYYYDKSGWMWSDSWCVSDKLFKWLNSTNCRYKNIAYRINRSSFSNQVFFCITNGLIKPGDLLFFSHSENGKYTHTVFVENIDIGKNAITILQHGNDDKYGHRKVVNIELFNKNGYDHCMLVHFYFNLK